MELKMNDYQLPERISFNFEELKAELTEKVHLYETLVYSDEQIKEAKEDRANLNKLKKALNDERIRREKEYMIPFNSFKAKIAELVGIIDKASSTVDLQVKAYEDKQKAEKKEKIEEIFDDMELISFGWLKLEQIFDEKWLNASVSLKSVKDEILGRIAKINRDIDTLSNLPEFGFEALEAYKTTLDINKAIYEAQRMSQIAKAKAEVERLRAEAEAKADSETQPVQEGFMNTPEGIEVIDKPKTWVQFAALMTVDQAYELKKFFDDRHIEFKAV